MIVFSFPQITFEDWFITLYNLVYSSLPVLLVGLLDQVKAEFVVDQRKEGYCILHECKNEL